MFGSSGKNKNAEFVGKVQAARQQRAEEKEREKAAIQIQVCIVSFYFFHFRTLSYFLIKFDTSESFFFFCILRILQIFYHFILVLCRHG